MKGLLLGIIIGLLSCNLTAQITSGSVLFSGNANYNKTKNDQNLPSNPIVELESESFSVLPSFGFFVNNSILIGVGLKAEFESNSYLIQRTESSFNPFLPSTYTIQTSYKEKTRMFYFNPFFTRYNGITERLYFTTAFNLLIGSGETRGGTVQSYTSKNKELSLNFTPGLTYFFSPKWAINGSIGQIYYRVRKESIPNTTNTINNNNETEDEEFGVDASWNSFRIGLQYLINKNFQK